MNASPDAVWRVAALTMMPPAVLRDLLARQDAAVWVEAAAACGLSEALVRQGRMLLSGEGAAKNPHAAFACFSRAAEAGDADARNMLGRCHEHGWGTRADPARAAHCYRQAGEAGHAWAQYNLGHLLLDGNGVRCDRDAAFAWYGRAAAQGHARAMNLVGRCHEEGWGTARDAAAARAWYRRAAEGGYFRGAYNYASILAQEGCIPGAVFWFARALDAPEPTRGHILGALARHENPRIRGLALSKPPTIA